MIVRLLKRNLNMENISELKAKLNILQQYGYGLIAISEKNCFTIDFNIECKGTTLHRNYYKNNLSYELNVDEDNQQEVALLCNYIVPESDSYRLKVKSTSEEKGYFHKKIFQRSNMNLDEFIAALHANSFGRVSRIDKEPLGSCYCITFRRTETNVNFSYNQFTNTAKFTVNPHMNTYEKALIPYNETIYFPRDAKVIVASQFPNVSLHNKVIEDKKDLNSSTDQEIKETDNTPDSTDFDVRTKFKY